MDLTYENYLMCKNVPIARTGIQVYQYHEGLCDENGPLPPNSNGEIEVFKPEEVLFSKATMDSFEKKPVTLNHVTVTPDNFKQSAVGIALNVRRGTGRFSNNLMADLLIQDRNAIEIIKKNKMREISLGYEASYVSDGAGKAHQTSIIGNHIAIVPKGKAGPLCRIYDSLPFPLEVNMLSIKDKVKKMFMQTFDSIDFSSLLGDSKNTESTSVSSNKESQYVSIDQSVNQAQPGAYMPTNDAPFVQSVQPAQPMQQASVPNALPAQGGQMQPNQPINTQQLLVKIDTMITLLNQVLNQGKTNQQQAPAQPAPAQQAPAQQQAPAKPRFVSINPNNPMYM